MSATGVCSVSVSIGSSMVFDGLQALGFMFVHLHNHFCVCPIDGGW